MLTLSHGTQKLESFTGNPFKISYHTLLLQELFSHALKAGNETNQRLPCTYSYTHTITKHEAHHQQASPFISPLLKSIEFIIRSAKSPSLNLRYDTLISLHIHTATSRSTRKPWIKDALRKCTPKITTTT